MIVPRKSSDLREREQQQIYTAPAVEVPVTTVIERLNTASGPGLELTTRATPAICKAAAMADVYARIYGIGFVSGQVDLMMRLAVSQDGKGREDMIRALEAGGQLPAEYYSEYSGRSEPVSDEEGRRN